MRPSATRRSLALVTLAVAAAPTAAAGSQLELTPFAGYRMAGDFESADQDGRIDVRDGSSLGVSLGWYRDAESFYEILYSRRKAELGGTVERPRADDLSIEYLHFGGTLLLPRPTGHAGYVSLTAGVTRLDGSPGRYSAERKLSASLGGGLRYPLGDRVTATLGVRAWYTFVDSSTDLVCVSIPGEAGCLVRSSSSGLWELEATAGLTFRFGAR